MSSWPLRNETHGEHALVDQIAQASSMHGPRAIEHPPRRLDVGEDCDLGLVALLLDLDVGDAYAPADYMREAVFVADAVCSEGVECELLDVVWCVAGDFERVHVLGEGVWIDPTAFCSEARGKDRHGEQLERGRTGRRRGDGEQVAATGGIKYVRVWLCNRGSPRVRDSWRQT